MFLLCEELIAARKVGAGERRERSDRSDRATVGRRAGRSVAEAEREHKCPQLLGEELFGEGAKYLCKRGTFNKNQKKNET